MKRILPLSFLVVSAAWVYIACSDDPIEEPGNPVLDGGPGGDTDSGGPTDNDGGSGPSDSGTNPDAPVVFTGNPIEGVAAAKAITPGDFTDFADGPIWRAGKLYFTLPGSYYVIEFTPPNVFRQARDYTALNPSLSPIGQTYDTKTSSVITTEAEIGPNPTNRLVRWTADAGGTTAVALAFDASAGATPWDSPNDLVARADGTLYVTDPGYQRFNNGGPRTNRLFRITPTGGVFEEKTFDLNPEPNGIALSPDGNTLYVSFSETKKVVKFPLNPAGLVGAEAPFATTTGTPDGMNVDTAGNVYIATDTGVDVHKPDGTKWGTVATPKPATGIAFGGADMKTLYITANGGVYEVTGLKVAGSTQ